MAADSPSTHRATGQQNDPGCEALQEDLAGLALGTSASDEEAVIRAHIASCAVCAATLDQYERVLGALREHSANEPLRAPRFAALCQTVDHAVAHLRQAPRRRMLAASIAAVLLLAIGLGVGVARHLYFRQNKEVFSIAWKQAGITPLEGGMDLYPLVRGRMLFALERVGGALRVVALDGETGVRRWCTSFDVWEPFQADANKLYVWTPVGEEVELVAMDHRSGRELWRCQCRGLPAMHAPALVTVEGGLAWSERGTVRFVDSETGRVRWSRSLGHADRVSLASDGRSALFAATPAATLALRLTDGGTVWRHEHEISRGDQPAAALVVHGAPGLYVAVRYASLQGRLLNLDPASGTCRWSRAIGIPVSLQAIGEEVVVRSTLLEVFEGRSGRRLWRASVPGCAPVTLADGKMYVPGGKTQPEVWLLDGRTGRRLGSQPLVSSCTGVVLEGRRGYLSGSDGVLYAMQGGG